ncbi:MAG: hypothetical protein LBL79_11505 [Prevotella sp.]|jgi:hypothetical protein|nr:hypothetical protein [Prevotella sp.]
MYVKAAQKFNKEEAHEQKPEGLYFHNRGSATRGKKGEQGKLPERQLGQVRYSYIKQHETKTLLLLMLLLGAASSFAQQSGSF